MGCGISKHRKKNKIAIDWACSSRYIEYNTLTQVNNTRKQKMIQVCLKDGFVVYEFATVAEFKEAFPTGLDADAIASGCFVQSV